MTNKYIEKIIKHYCIATSYITLHSYIFNELKISLKKENKITTTTIDHPKRQYVFILVFPKV